MKKRNKLAAALHNEGRCLFTFYAVIRGLTFKTLRVPGSQLLHRFDKLPSKWYIIYNTVNIVHVLR